MAGLRLKNDNGLLRYCLGKELPGDLELFRDPARLPSLDVQVRDITMLSFFSPVQNKDLAVLWPCRILPDIQDLGP